MAKTRARENSLDQSSRKLLPALSGIFLTILLVLPLGIPEWQSLAPPITVAVVFYWSVTRPELMPPILAFMLGLFADLLTGAPLGVGALIMVLTQWALRGQQRFLGNRPFFLLWLAFAPVLVVACGLEWLIASAFAFHVIAISGAVARLLLAFVIFPLVAWVVLIPIQRILPPAIQR